MISLSSLTVLRAGQNGPPGLLAFNVQSVVSLLIRGFFLPAIPMPLRTFQFATLNGSDRDSCAEETTCATAIATSTNETRAGFIRPDLANQCTTPSNKVSPSKTDDLEPLPCVTARVSSRLSRLRIRDRHFRRRIAAGKALRDDEWPAFRAQDRQPRPEHDRRDETDGATERQGVRRADLLGDESGEQRSERCHADEHHRVDGHHASAQRRGFS